MIFALEEPDGETLRAQVLKVFDGDGFLAQVSIPPRGQIEISVRCGFIDAPEMQQLGGEAAKAFFKQQIDGQWLDLALLVKMDTGGMVDRHRRIVAVPYLRSDQHGWRNIELEMILNGWAWLLERYCPPEHYFGALEEARRNRRGIWARDDNIHPGRFKSQNHRRGSQQRNSPSSPVFTEVDRPCPKEGCNGHLVRRSRKFGFFYGCSEFPICRYARTSLD